MQFEWNEEKARSNAEKHGVSFELVTEFEFGTALFEQQEVAGEIRHALTGFIGDRLHVLIMTEREGIIRVISLRKANKREVKAYEQES